jgi:tRNA (guanine37-N1)-methyltransferase
MRIRMRIDILTLFPEMCEAVLSESIIGRARKNGFITIKCHNIRDYTTDKHRHVDDMTYGGGTGMIMQAAPIYNCFSAVCDEIGARPTLIYMSPAGKVFNQQTGVRYSQLEHMAILCGHYEGVDERIIEELVDEEVSIGDFVLTGGELPAMILADAVARLLPGVLKSEESFMNESHFSGLLEYPQYTRPSVFMGREVPEVLQNGHHANIEKWRREASLRRTLERRPDMLSSAALTREDAAFLAKLRRENTKQ